MAVGRYFCPELVVDSWYRNHAILLINQLYRLLGRVALPVALLLFQVRRGVVRVELLGGVFFSAVIQFRRQWWLLHRGVLFRAFIVDKSFFSVIFFLVLLLLLPLPSLSLRLLLIHLHFFLSSPILFNFLCPHPFLLLLLSLLLLCLPPLEFSSPFPRHGKRYQSQTVFFRRKGGTSRVQIRHRHLTQRLLWT